MANLYNTIDINDVGMLILLFKMLNYLRLLDDIQFDKSHFYDVISEIFLQQISMNELSLFMVDVSNIWGGILNGSRGIIKIKSIHTLAMNATLFSIELSYKLEILTPTSYKIQMTKIKSRNSM
ncbi:hypothetical protein RF11_12949 [Thelohanellus kitauei]|uniref:Uncharacterized protein n=1 Tax=Thelohanellus kitauei TaxID=669202 RepID=A0A0C2MHZ7_THEKT|nr:hypothetical protein RF11_12949 [Thelohanellus kitauei]